MWNGSTFSLACPSQTQHVTHHQYKQVTHSRRIVSLSFSTLFLINVNWRLIYLHSLNTLLTINVNWQHIHIESNTLLIICVKMQSNLTCLSVPAATRYSSSMQTGNIFTVKCPSRPQHVTRHQCATANYKQRSFPPGLNTLLNSQCIPAPHSPCRCGADDVLRQLRSSHANIEHRGKKSRLTSLRSSSKTTFYTVTCKLKTGANNTKFL